MSIEMATLHTETCTRSRVKTYILDSSSGNHGAMHVEERKEHHSDHSDGYTPCWHMSRMITNSLDSSSQSSECGRKGTTTSAITELTMQT